MGDVISMDGGLFPEPPRAAAEGAPASESRRAADRRAARQAQAIGLGQHPLSVPLGVSIPLGFPSETCGGCMFRRRVHGGNRSYPKCTARPIPREHVDRHGKTWRWEDYPRATHGAGTDVSAWWPACINFQPATPTRSEEKTR